MTAIRAAITQTTWTGDKQLGAYYNAAVVVGADGTVLGKYRKNPHSEHRQVLGRSSTSAPATSDTGVPDRRRPDRGVHLLTTVTFLKARGSSHAASRAS